MQKSEWASWAQAVFTVVAILASAGIVSWQHSLARKLTRLESAQADIGRVGHVVELCSEVAKELFVALSYSLGDAKVPSTTQQTLDNVLESLTNFDVSNFEPSSQRPRITSAQNAATTANHSVRNITQWVGGLMQIDPDQTKQRITAQLDVLNYEIAAMKSWIAKRERSV